MRKQWSSLLAATLICGCSRESRLHLKADTGDPQAMYEYGVYLIGVRPNNHYTDAEKGVQWVERAALKGHPEAMRKLGGIFALGVMPEQLQKAIFWYTRAAESGNRSAMLELANAHRFGELGLTRDEVKAAYWDKKLRDATNTTILAPRLKLAASGKADTLALVARTYEKELLEPHFEEAVDWYTKAAVAGDRDSMMRLCNAYQRGELGLAKDQAKSDHWFRKWQEATRATPRGN